MRPRGHTFITLAVCSLVRCLAQIPADQLEFFEKRIRPDLTEWIKMGAPDPRIEAAAAPVKKSIDFAEARKFWSFQPLKTAAPPAGKQDVSAIDRLLLARLTEKSLEPASRADKRTLIRRV